MSELDCPVCQGAITLDPSTVGRKAECPACGRSLEAPGDSSISSSRFGTEAIVTAPSVDPSLAGIGGWLVFPALHLTLGPIVNLFQWAAQWESVQSMGQTVVQAVRICAALDGLFLIYTVVVAVTFFRRLRIAPPLMICFYVGNVGIALAASAVISSMLKVPADYADVARPVIFSCIWIPYFLVSRRVKATFTR